MIGKYILDEKGEPVRETDLIKWSRWMETLSHRVIREEVGGPQSGVSVSTIFLGLDHSFSEDGPPVLWECMIFGGELNHEQRRCSGSREQALAMHAEMVALAKSKLDENTSH